MAGKSSSILIKILSDATDFGKGFDEADGTIGKVGKGFQSALLPATAIVAGLTAGALSFRDAAEENVISGNRLDAVFRSMGDATGEASRQAQEYASVLSQQIGVEDDTIEAAQAKLATFSAVSGEVGRQEGIFNRATAAAADLAAAGFGTMDTNAAQLGKALQDPVKGLAGLTKSGVTFTNQQRDQIKALQESGDVLGAQKIVLAAVEGQVKGTAEATATSSAKQRVAWGEVQESLGMKLQPTFDRLSVIMLSVFGWIGDHVDLVVNLGAALGALASFVIGVNVAMSIWTAITTAATAVQAAFNFVMSANPIGIIIVAIAALVAGLVYFFTQTETGKAVWANVWGFIKSTAQAVGNWFTGTLVPWFQSVWAAIQAGLAAVGKFFSDTWAAIVTAVQTAVGFVLNVLFNVFIAPLQAAWQAFWGVFGGVLTAAWDLIVAAVQFAVTLVQVVLFQAWNFISSTATAAWNGLVGIVTAVWDSIVAAVTWYLDGLKAALTIAWDFISGAATAAWTAVSGAVTTAWNTLTGAVSAGVAQVQSWITRAWDRVKEVTFAAWAMIPSGIRDKIGEAVRFVAELPGKALDALGDIGTKLLNAGKSLIQGFVDGITRSFGNVKTTLQDLTAKLTQWKGPADRDATLLTGAGQLVIDGFITGLESRYGAARKSLQGFTSDLSRTPGPTLAAQWAGASSGRWSSAADAPSFAVYVQAIPDGEYVRSQARVVAQGEIRSAAAEYMYGGS